MPVTDPETRQTIIDDEHLKLLAIGYTISGVITAILSLFGLVYAAFGIVMSVALHGAFQGAPKEAVAPPAAFGWIFAVFGLGMFLLTAAFAGAKFFAASCIRRRRARTFCLVMAGIACLGVPYGTLLGIATFMVFGRPGVIAQFSRR